MVKIRIYFIPSGYKDIVCEAVNFNAKDNFVIVIGGKEDGEIYENCKGAKMLNSYVKEDK